MQVIQKLGLTAAALLLSVSTVLACPQQPCDQKGQQCATKMQACHGKKDHYVAHIKGALKKLPLAQEHWDDVKMAVDGYRKTMQSIQKGLPLDALKNGAFDKEAFMRNHPMTKRLEAKAELLETIYLLLDDEQKKRLPMLLGAEAFFGGKGGMCQNQCGDKAQKCDGKGAKCEPKHDGTGPKAAK